MTKSTSPSLSQACVSRHGEAHEIFIQDIAGKMLEGEGGNVRHFFSNMACLILEPIITLIHKDVVAWGGHLTFDFEIPLSRALVETWLQDGFTEQEIIERGEQLSRTWHHPAIRFAPHGMELPEGIIKGITPKSEWHTILPAPYTTKSGAYVLTGFCNQDDLDRAHKVLGQCTDTYTKQCFSGSTHLISISSKDGTLLSTVNIQVLPSEECEELPKPSSILIGGYYITLVEHETKRINNVAQHVVEGPLHEAIMEWLGAVANGRTPIQLSLIGQTEESKLDWKRYYKNNGDRYVVERVGYFPTWQNIYIAFQELKKSSRGGSIGVDAGNRILYPPKRPQLIEGTVTQNGEILDQRNMSAIEWCRAIGLLGRAADYLYEWDSPHLPEHYVDLKKRLRYEQERSLTASCPAPKTPEQFAYALAAGTLLSHETYRLTPQERSAYEKRIADRNRDARTWYFGCH